MTATTNSAGGDKPETNRLHHFPIIITVYFVVTFGVCYGIALKNDHIDPHFPFISDLGTLGLEQHVFSLLVNVGAGLLSRFMQIRYIQAERLKERYNIQEGIFSWNGVTLRMGYTSAFGMAVVGNFPVLQQKEVHYVGASLAFIFVGIYAILQGLLTDKLLPCFHQSKYVARFRIGVGILTILLYFGAMIAVLGAIQQNTSETQFEISPRALKWERKDGGYELRKYAVIMEYICFIIFEIFILTFVAEFKKFKLNPFMEVIFTVDADGTVPDIVGSGQSDMKDDQDGNGDHYRQ